MAILTIINAVTIRPPSGPKPPPFRTFPSTTLDVSSPSRDTPLTGIPKMLPWKKFHVMWYPIGIQILPRRRNISEKRTPMRNRFTRGMTPIPLLDM
jgi:hypothetical protein